MEEKEKRVRAVTKLYYSQPKIQEYLANFSKDREVVPRYYEGFGKRPDTLHYPSDVMGLVLKGATSFHASEEIWKDPLLLNSEMRQEEMNALRLGWDLLIDIDSPFLDCSKVATQLLVAALEQHGIKNYGIKYSGSRGFHLIVGSKAFPAEYDGLSSKDMFPEWPRAIAGYLMNYIREDYNRQSAALLINIEALERRTQRSRDSLMVVRCLQCDRPAKERTLFILKCSTCGLKHERKDMKLTKRKLRCLDEKCAGILEVVETKPYRYCEYCKDPQNENLPLSSDRNADSFERGAQVSAEEVAALDLVLVAPRHLFRMPYSLHEKTALASIVLYKNEIASFSPKDADPLRVKLMPFIADYREGEASKLIAAALEWKRNALIREGQEQQLKIGKQSFSEVDMSAITEKMFPPPIKRLLLGLKDGKKRGLFILITFLRSLQFSDTSIEQKVRNWNKLNDPPLKEGYLQSQLSWHFKQRKKILPPNYDNDSFYKDLNLLEGKPTAKNPIVEVKRQLWKKKQFSRQQ